MKLTKRKAFNFLRSYFDVLNELETDKQKLDFLLSIINKQFLDEDPKELEFIVNLCYQSQRHAIESSVKGWKRANKAKALGTNPPTNPPTNPKEEKEEEKEEVQLSMNFLYKNTAWRNNFLKHYSISLEEYEKKLKAFSIGYDMDRPEKELKQHFFNWFKTQDYKKQVKAVPHFNAKLKINTGK